MRDRDGTYGSPRGKYARGGFLPVVDRIPRWGTALTWVFLVGSSAFACTSGFGGWAMVRVLAKMVGVDVSA